jgi:hypothetical protein
VHEGTNVFASGFHSLTSFEKYGTKALPGKCERTKQPSGTSAHHNNASGREGRLRRGSWGRSLLLLVRVDGQEFHPTRLVFETQTGTNRVAAIGVGQGDEIDVQDVDEPRTHRSVGSSFVPGIERSPDHAYGSNRRRDIPYPIYGKDAQALLKSTNDRIV